MDLHSYAADIVMVQDYTAKQTTIIYPANTTYPQGLCQVSRARAPGMPISISEYPMRMLCPAQCRPCPQVSTCQRLGSASCCDTFSGLRSASPQDVHNSTTRAPLPFCAPSLPQLVY